MAQKLLASQSLSSSGAEDKQEPPHFQESTSAITWGGAVKEQLRRVFHSSPGPFKQSGSRVSANVSCPGHYPGARTHARSIGDDMSEDEDEGSALDTALEAWRRRVGSIYRKHGTSPSRLHQYRFKREIGKGSYGKVRLMQKLHTARTVTQSPSTLDRQIEPDSGGGELCVLKESEDLEAANHEVELLRKLSGCPSVIRVRDAFTEDIAGTLNMFIELEFCNGGDLHGWISGMARRGNRFGEQTISSMLVQLCDAIAYIHKHRIIHCDIKPANILLKVGHPSDLSSTAINQLSPPKGTSSSTGTSVYPCQPSSHAAGNAGPARHHVVDIQRLQVKLCDFGVCKLLEHTGASTHHMAGSRAFMAPEVLRYYIGEPVRFKSSADVWSVGAVAVAVGTVNACPRCLSSPAVASHDAHVAAQARPAMPVQASIAHVPQPRASDSDLTGDSGSSTRTISQGEGSDIKQQEAGSPLTFPHLLRRIVRPVIHGEARRPALGLMRAMEHITSVYGPKHGGHEGKVGGGSEGVFHSGAKPAHWLVQFIEATCMEEPSLRSTPEELADFLRAHNRVSINQIDGVNGPGRPKVKTVLSSSGAVVKGRVEYAQPFSSDADASLTSHGLVTVPQTYTTTSGVVLEPKVQVSLHANTDNTARRSRFRQAYSVIGRRYKFSIRKSTRSASLPPEIKSPKVLLPVASHTVSCCTTETEYV